MRRLYLAAAVGLFLLVGLEGGAFRLADDTVTLLAERGNVANAVTVVYLGVRLYDTLFEVLVFSVAVLGVTVHLARDEGMGNLPDDPALLFMVRGGAFVALLIGAAQALTGHLAPGGGFAAGVSLATGAVLLQMGPLPALKGLDEEYLLSLEKGLLILFLCLAWTSLLGFSLPPGERGRLFSGGLLLPLNLSVSVKVALGAWIVALRFLHHHWVF
ncbi:MAG: hypothetical protein JMJ93_08035 [Synergistaceae bacterium]|nr:hypothetical protein [Synergistaceae bacterium]